MRLLTHTPYWHQLELWSAMQGGCKRAVLNWHRRAGKDWAAWWWLVNQAVQVRANYSYFFPTRTLGKQVIFEGIDPETGSGYLDGVPKELIESRREDEAYVRLVNGSQIRIIGTDTGEIVGPNPYGTVFSEYSLQNPSAWTYVRPILERNGGWAIFTATPRGDNHFKSLVDAAEKRKDWFYSKRTIWHTGLIKDSSISEMLDTGYTLDYILSEFFCDFSAAFKFAYWESELRAARESGRVRPGINYVPDKPIYAAWDIGNDDHTAIWLGQYIAGKLYLIDYYDGRGQRLEVYLGEMHKRAPFVTKLLMPWDARKRDSDGHTTMEIRLLNLGYQLDVIPKISKIRDDIDMVRRKFQDVYIDSQRCEKGVYCLQAYRPSYDERKRTFSDEPMRDYAAHGASAFRYFLRAIENGLVTGEESLAEGPRRETLDTTWGGRVNVGAVRGDVGGGAHRSILRRIRGPAI